MEYVTVTAVYRLVYSRNNRDCDPSSQPRRGVLLYPITYVRVRYYAQVICIGRLVRVIALHRRLSLLKVKTELFLLRVAYSYGLKVFC